MILPSTDILIDFIRYAPFMFLMGGGGIARIAMGAGGFGIGGLFGFPAVGAAIGMALGSLLFPPKQEKKVRQVRSVLGTSAVEGVPVSIIYGRVRVGGTIMWKDKVVFHQIIQRTRGGKGGGESQSRVIDEWWTINIAFGIGEGPLSLHQIYAGKKKVGKTSYTWHSGTPSQTVDTFLLAQTGKAIAYRNTAYIVLHDYNLGRADSLPQFTFEVSSGSNRQVDLTSGSAEFNTWLTHSERVSGGDISDEWTISRPMHPKFNSYGLGISPEGTIWRVSAGFTGPGGSEAVVISRDSNKYVFWPPSTTNYPFPYISSLAPHDIVGVEASGPLGTEQLIVFLNQGWTNQYWSLAIYNLTWDGGSTNGSEPQAPERLLLGWPDIRMLGVFPLYGDVYFAYKVHIDATWFYIGKRILIVDPETGLVVPVYNYEVINDEEIVEEVYFVKGVGNISLFMVCSTGSVYSLEGDEGFRAVKIDKNNLDDDHEFAVIGGVSNLSTVIYAAYTENDTDIRQGHQDATKQGKNGILKTFNTSTGKWSATRIYETLGVLDWNSTYGDNDRNVFPIPIHVEGSGMYFVKNYDDVNWSILGGNWQDGNRLQVSVDGFETVTEIDQYTHWGTFLYIPQIDSIYRPIGWDEGNRNDVEDDTDVEIPGHTSTTNYNDILYSRTPPDGDFGIITTAAAMYDVITNDRYGGGFDNKEIEHISAIQDCIAENYYLNVAITERRDLASVLEIMSVHGWVALIYSGAIIKLLVAKNTTAVDTVELSDLLGKQGENTIDVAESSRSERFNRLTIEYTDPEKDFSVRPVMVEDLADQQTRDGGIYKNTVSLNGFVVKETAMTLGQKMLRSSLWGRKLLNFTLGPESLAREPGDVITMDIPVVGLNTARYRVLAIDETPEFNLVVSAREEPIYIYDDVNYSVPGSLAEGAASPLAGLSNVVGFTPIEVPFEMSSDTSRVELALLWSKKATETVGIDFYYSQDGGTSYLFLMSTFSPQSGGIIQTNSVLGSDLWVDESSFEVETSIGVDSSFDSVTRPQMFAGQNLFIIEDEMSFIQTATVGTSTDYTLSTLLRGRFNTLVQTHPAGATVFNINNPSLVHFDTTDIGSTYPIKAVPINTQGESMELSDVPATNFTVEGWAFRPYPPSPVQLKEGDVSLRGVTTTRDRDITLTWGFIDKSVGYGRGGWGAHPYGTSSAEDTLFRGTEIDVYHDAALVNTYTVGTTTFGLVEVAEDLFIGIVGAYMTEITYTEAQNIADNPGSTFEDEVMFRLFNKSIYGRSKDFTEITVNVV